MTGYTDVYRVFSATLLQRVLPAVMLLGGLFPSAAQAQSVTLVMEEVPLRAAFASLERQSELRFVYEDALIDDVYVSIECTACDPLEALADLLRGLPLRFEESGGGQIVLLRGLPRYRVEGAVVDAESGESLPLAHVYLDQAGVAADRNGEFVFDSVPSGSYTAVVRYLGFRHLSIRVEVPSASNLEFRLTRVASDVGSIVVQGAPTVPIDDRPGQATTIGLRGIMSVPGVAGGDPLNALSQLPGVDSSEESAAGLYIRGSTPDDNLLQWEGIPLFNAEHFFGMISAFSPDVVGSVRMYTRTSPARLGGRTGGFVLLDGAPALGGVRLAATASPLLGGVSGRFPIGSRAGVLISFRRSMPTLNRSGAYRTYFDSVLGSTSVGQTSPGFFFQDLNARVVSLLGNRHVLSLNVHSGRDELRQTFGEETTLPSGNEVEESTENRWSNTGASGVWTGSWTDRTRTTGILSFSRYANRYHFENDGDETEVGLAASNAVREARLTIRQEVDLTESIGIRGGAFVKRYEVTFSGENSAPAATEVSQEANATIAGSYLEGRVDFLKKRVSATAGLRGSWHDATARAYLEPRVHLVMRLGEAVSVEGSMGRHHQFLSRVLGSDVLTESRDRWDLADKANPPARSTQRSLRLRVVHGDITGSFELYRNSLTGVDELSRRRGLSELERTTGIGTASGLEGQLRFTRPQMSTWITYSRSRIRYQFASVNSNVPFAPLHERPHNLRLAFEASAGHWAFGARFTLASGRRAVIPDGQRSIDPLGTVIESQAPQDARLPQYQRLDLQLRRTLRRSGFGAEIELAVVNVFDRMNVRHRRYSTVAEQLQFQEIQMLGFTPVLTIRVGNSRL